MSKKYTDVLALFFLAWILSACTASNRETVKQSTDNNKPTQPKTNTHTHAPQQTIRTKPKPKPFKVQVNPAQILSSHNKVRSRYRLPSLSWSPSLAKFSTNWARHLKKTNGCAMQHRPHSGRFKTDFGENLYWASPFRWSDGGREIQKITSAAVVHEWAREVRHYNYQSNRCQPGQQCGHYTQVVWKDSKNVGCGLAICPDKSQVWVCSYDPPGNWQGQRPY